MIELRLSLERIEQGHVRAEVHEVDQLDGKDVLLWSCSANQSSTRDAQKEVLRATLKYLNRFCDLSQGGDY